MEEDVKKFRDRLPSATLDEQIEYLEEKLEIIQVHTVQVDGAVHYSLPHGAGAVYWLHSEEEREELETAAERSSEATPTTETSNIRCTNFHTRQVEKENFTTNKVLVQPTKKF